MSWWRRWYLRHGDAGWRLELQLELDRLRHGRDLDLEGAPQPEVVRANMVLKGSPQSEVTRALSVGL